MTNPVVPSRDKIPPRTVEDCADECAVWCVEGDGHAVAKFDPACWGAAREVALTMEPGYDHQVRETEILRLDPPRVGVYPYRREPLCREVVYLHIYRPHENEFRDLDADVHLTADEAMALAEHLRLAAREIAAANGVFIP